MKALDTILDLLFPPKCPFCRRVVDHTGICGACEKALPWTEGEAGLHKGAGGFICAAPLFYEGTVREALLRLKFHGESHLAGPLGMLVARCAAEQFSGNFDVVTWVPVGPKRLRERGYDQARLLAEAACQAWEIRPERLLEKMGDNPAQSGLGDSDARRANVLGMYTVPSAARTEGRRILLVDDICTTGATLTECVRTLKDDGATSVVCVAAALTQPQKEAAKKQAKKC
ncbi:double zinc ribbon domain-containing protein [Oscillibacter sp.]|uniref:ComF family protein n=1 Tax=Oscillibacter sp. TaxID=1945593 RepID=UPI0028B1BF9C|nr:double zinc ribbon domain-containing protein [Oscillibacter sp.]